MTTLVVTEDIPFGDPGRGVYAARAGDRISKEVVEANGWEAYVAPATTTGMKKADLIAEAERRGLDTSGTVDELRERLATPTDNPEGN